MIAPPFLRPGDTVGVVAPASRFDYNDLRPGLALLRHEWQLNVLEGVSLTAHSGPFAGSIALRQHDIQTMLDDPAIRAVFAARGGYGSYQLVDVLDFTKFRQYPKWFVGFSDITLLHCQIEKTGVQSLHAVMPRQFAKPEAAESVESLRRWLFGVGFDYYSAPAHALNRPGQASGTLIGGNLTLLLHTLATPTEPDWQGKILFIEDVDETFFSIDRMLTQLRRAGRLAQLAGLVVGQFSDLRENTSLPYGQPIEAVIAAHLDGLDCPVCFDFPVGHTDRNLAMPIGRPVELVVGTGEARLNFHSDGM
ncbi:MAG: LD-carboxypeptidase [Bacteroidetes bacterium]|nr:LD-carboxypeptidase [Fibrella sp.]